MTLRLYGNTKEMWFASNFEDLLFIHYCVQWIDFNTFFFRRQHFKSMVRNTLIWIQFFCKQNFTDSSFSCFHKANAVCGNIEDLLVVHFYAELIDFNILLLTRQHFKSMVKNSLIWLQFISKKNHWHFVFMPLRKQCGSRAILRTCYLFIIAFNGLILTLSFSDDNTSSPWSKIPWSESNFFPKKFHWQFIFMFSWRQCGLRQHWGPASCSLLCWVDWF